MASATAPKARIAQVRTVAFQGIDVLPVEVQVQIGPGLPAFTIVGLPDKAVAESRERVRAALGAVGLSLPPKRITVNLAPADLQKEGSHFDLPIALGILIGTRAIPADLFERHVGAGRAGPGRCGASGQWGFAGRRGRSGRRACPDLPGCLRR